MTKDDIIRMAREAGLHSAVLLHIYGKEAALCDSEIEELRQIKAFANLVAAAEREECAKVAEQFEPDEKTSYVMYASKAIRARGNT